MAILKTKQVVFVSVRTLAQVIYIIKNMPLYIQTNV